MCCRPLALDHGAMVELDKHNNSLWLLFLRLDRQMYSLFEVHHNLEQTPEKQKRALTRSIDLNVVDASGKNDAIEGRQLAA